MRKLALVSSQAPLAPPYPPDLKARGWTFDVDLEKVKASDTWALAHPDQRPWLWQLWIESWACVPIGSYPDDDQVIAARIGMRLDLFQAWKAALMRGWWKASDGRLYHNTIIELVHKMVAHREKDRARSSRYYAGLTRDNTGLTRDNTGLTREKRASSTPTPTNTPTPKDSQVLKTLNPPKARAARKVGSRLPADWKVTPGMKAWATKARPDLDLELVSECFVDHWSSTAGKNASKLDWDAAFRNWVRKEDRSTMMRGAQSQVSRWWESEQATEAQAKLLGMRARGGETWDAFRNRIREAMKR